MTRWEQDWQVFVENWMTLPVSNIGDKVILVADVEKLAHWPREVLPPGMVIVGTALSGVFAHPGRIFQKGHQPTSRRVALWEEFYE
jgi:hypothetical protein